MFDLLLRAFQDPEMFKTLGLVLGQAGGQMNSPFAGLGNAAANYLAGEKYTKIANQQAGQPTPSKVTIQYPTAPTITDTQGQGQTQQAQPAQQQSQLSGPTTPVAPNAQVPQMLAQGAQTQNFLQSLLPLWR